MFYSAEGYVIRWEYRVYKEPPKQIVRRGQRRRHSTIHEFGGRQRCCYFFWQGKECTVTEKGAAAVITVELDEEKGPQVVMMLNTCHMICHSLVCRLGFLKAKSLQCFFRCSVEE